MALRLRTRLLYHTLTRQGKNAPGGAKSYIVNGKMTRGIRICGLSADTGQSGVMTFIRWRGKSGVSKDLGKNTEVPRRA